MEDLTGVAGTVGVRDRAGARLRAEERTARERYDVFPGSGTVTDEALRDQHAVAVADPEHTLVEEFVVQRAQAQPVVDLVRTVESPPLVQPSFQRSSR